MDYILDSIDLAWQLHVPARKLVRFDPCATLVDHLVPFYQVAAHGLVLYHAGYGYQLSAAGLTPDQACDLELALGALPLNEVGYRKGWYIPAHRDWLAAMGRHYRKVCGEQPDRIEQFIDRMAFDPSTGELESIYEDGRVFRAKLPI